MLGCCTGFLLALLPFGYGVLRGQVVLGLLGFAITWAAGIATAVGCCGEVITALFALIAIHVVASTERVRAKA